MDHCPEPIRLARLRGLALSHWFDGLDGKEAMLALSHQLPHCLVSQHRLPKLRKIFGTWSEGLDGDAQSVGVPGRRFGHDCLP